MRDRRELGCLRMRSESSQEARSLKSRGTELAVGNILDADSVATRHKVHESVVG